MAMFVASWPAGIALGLISFPPIAAAYSWVAVMQAAAAAAVVCLLLLALVYRSPLARRFDQQLLFCYLDDRFLPKCFLQRVELFIYHRRRRRFVVFRTST